MEITFDPHSEKDRALIQHLLSVKAKKDTPPAKDMDQRPSGDNTPEARDCQFGIFWSVVHAKIKVRRAEEAFHKAVDRVAKERNMDRAEASAFICDRMEAYAKSPAGRPADRNPTHPSTWLNGAQYDDDPATWQESGAQQRRFEL